MGKADGDSDLKHFRLSPRPGGCRADAVQIFDSWVGCLSPADYERFVFPHVKKLISAIPSDVPVILFGTGTSSLLELMGKTGAGVIGLDWRIDILDGWRRAGSSLAVQGNLDPVSMLSTPSHVVEEARKILDRVGGDLDTYSIWVTECCRKHRLIMF